MKKRILAMVLAVLTLVSAPALTALASTAWQQSSEYYNGGQIQYGAAELHSGNGFAVVRFAYGHNVSVSENTMKDIAEELGSSDFPVVSSPNSSEQLGSQDFFILMTDDLDSVDHLIVALEEKNNGTDTPSSDDGSDNDDPVSEPVVSATQVESVEDLSDDQVSMLFDLIGSLNFGKEKSPSASDVVSDADAASASDAVSETNTKADAAPVSNAVSDTDAASESDIPQVKPGSLFDLLSQLAMNVNESVGNYVSASDVTSGSDAVSDADAADLTSAATAAAEEPAAEPEAVSAADAAEQETVPEEGQPVSDTVIVTEPETTEPEAAEEEPSAPEGSAVDTLLALRTTGIYSADAKPTLEESLQAAFPEFNFTPAENLPLNVNPSQNVTLSEDGRSASVVVRPESEYVDIELNGKVFTVLLMNQKSTTYGVERVHVTGSTDPIVILPPVTTTTEPTTTTTAEVTTTSAEPTTEPTVTTTATTTTTTTTAVTTTTTTTTAAPTTTTTEAATTTAAPTTATTAPAEGELMLTGYVSTRSKDLRVRKGPGLGFAVITLIPKGTEVVVLDQPNENWYHVRLHDGTVGYCYSGYITILQGA